MQKTIVLIGGTGMLGRTVARRLDEDGFHVRIMTRDGQKAIEMFNGSLEIATGDPGITSCLEEALQGSYGVHISLPSEVERSVARTVAKVAAKHGVERISYVSGATVTDENRWLPMINRKFQAELAIRESGVPYTIFCPTWFMESLPMFVVKGRATVLGKQPYPYRWVAADDFAKMVSTAFGLAEAANQRFLVFGPEAIRMREALRRYCAVFHPDIQRVGRTPIWLVKLLATVTGDQGLRGAGELMSYFDKVGENGDPPSRNNGILRPPAMTLDLWLEMRRAKDKKGDAACGTS